MRYETDQKENAQSALDTRKNNPSTDNAGEMQVR